MINPTSAATPVSNRPRSNSLEKTPAANNGARSPYKDSDEGKQHWEKSPTQRLIQDATTRYTQLLFNPLTNTVTATEVEQKHHIDIWSDEKWRMHFEEQNKSELHHNVQGVFPGVFVVPSSSSSTCSSSDCSSLSSDSSRGSDRHKKTDIWEELIDINEPTMSEIRFNQGRSKMHSQQKGEASMPYLLSTLPLYLGPTDNAKSPLGQHLLSEDLDLIRFGRKKVPGNVRLAFSIQLKTLGKKVSEAFNAEHTVNFLSLCAIWCNRMDDSSNPYESIS